MEKKYIIWVLVGVVFVIMSVIFCHYARPIYDKDCLKEIAKDYCVENNLTFYKYPSGERYFYCNLDYNPRLESRPSFERFFFLNSEMDNCLIKYRWKWRTKHST